MNIQLVTHFHEAAIVPTINPKTHRYDGEWWMTLVDLSAVIDGQIVTIRSGFITNLGSIPKAARCLVDRTDQTLLGYVFHDYLYSKGTVECSRKYADRVLMKMAFMCGQSTFEARLVYWGCRIGASSAFKVQYPIFEKVEQELIDKICYDNGYFPEPESVMHNVNERVKARWASIREEQ